MDCRLTQVYEEIEPFCRWKRTENIDILELHLPTGLKKEHLKIQINNNGVLTITGDFPKDQNKSIKFKKETKVAKNCRRNEIRAKFSKGVLFVTMPKTNPIAVATSHTLNTKEDDTAKCASHFHSKFGSLKQRLWRKKVVEGVAALAVVVAAVVGMVKAYQLVMPSPV